jgi:hypothetical protein
MGGLLGGELEELDQIDKKRPRVYTAERAGRALDERAMCDPHFTTGLLL